METNDTHVCYITYAVMGAQHNEWMSNAEALGVRSDFVSITMPLEHQNLLQLPPQCQAFPRQI